MGRHHIVTYDMCEHVGWSETKDGVTVEVRFAEDVSPENRGFIDNETSVWIEKEKVGYLISTYVPKDKFQKFNPTIWNFASNFSGWSLGLRNFTSEQDVSNPYDLNEKEFDRFAKNTLHYLQVGDFSLSDKIFNKKEFYTLSKKSRKYKHLMEEEKKFKDFQVDSPYVGYIATRRNESRGVFNDNEGRGLGIILYLATAEIYSKKNLDFHSSSLQQPRAKELWDKFTQLGWTKNNGNRIAFNEKCLPDFRKPEDIFMEYREVKSNI